MKKYVFAAVAVIAVMFVTLSLNAQPGGGGGFGGGGGGGFGGGPGGGGMMMGMGGPRGPIVRPDKKARLASIAELEKQIAALKAAIEKAPEKDTEVTQDSDEATIQKATEERQAENDAISAIQTTLASLRDKESGDESGGARGGRMFRGASADVLSELRILANSEKATKTVAKLDALIKEAQTRTGRGARGARGGMMGGFGGGPGGGRGAGGGGGF